MSFDVLCCRPDYFKVVDTDNAHQQAGIKKWLENPEMWHARLLATWDAVAGESVKRGARLIQIPAHPDLPDQCFAADVVVAMSQRNSLLHFFPSQMNSPVRQQEVKFACQTLENHGYAVNVVADTSKHEGTGDYIWVPNHNFYVQGYGPRSESGIGGILSKLAYQNVYEVPLLVGNHQAANGLLSQGTKEFHIDTIVWPLPSKDAGGYIIGHFDGMHPSTGAFFENLYPPDRRICLTEAEADLFITNGLAVPDHLYKQGYVLFIPDKTPQHICDELEKWGYGLMKFDFAPSALSGGALHCMFNFIQKTVGGVGTVKAITEDGLPEGIKSLPPGIKFYSPKTTNILHAA